MCIGWTIKCLILLMYGATMKFITFHISRDHYIRKCTQAATGKTAV